MANAASMLTSWCSGTSYATQILWYRFALFTIKFTPLHWSTDQGVRDYKKYKEVSCFL